MTPSLVHDIKYSELNKERCSTYTVCSVGKGRGGSLICWIKIISHTGTTLMQSIESVVASQILLPQQQRKHLQTGSHRWSCCDVGVIPWIGKCPNSPDGTKRIVQMGVDTSVKCSWAMCPTGVTCTWIVLPMMDAPLSTRCLLTLHWRRRACHLGCPMHLAVRRNSYHHENKPVIQLSST